VSEPVLVKLIEKALQKLEVGE